MQWINGLVGLVLVLAPVAPSLAASNILFIGNSFTYGGREGAPEPSARGYKPFTVLDLNGTSIGGVPALFKDFTVQLGLDYSVSLAAVGGTSLEYHYDNRLAVIDKAWDKVVLQGHSVLDPLNPGNPASLITYTGLLADVFEARNDDVEIYLTATWSRADLTYRRESPWLGRPIDAMANDIAAGYALAAAASPHITGVIAVGAAWNDAMLTGLADSNPYDGIGAGQINLWSSDRYHGSLYGYYLSALMQLGAVTGADPRRLGAAENVAAHFGFSADHTVQLQDIAYDRLLASGAFSAVPEAATWAMLVCGFGLVGGALRHRRAGVATTATR